MSSLPSRHGQFEPPETGIGSSFLWRQTTVGTLSIAIASFGILGLAVVLPFLVVSFGFGAAVAGLVMPAVYVGCICTSVAGGHLADRWGGERIAALGLALLSSGMGLCAVAGGVSGYVLGAFVAGLGYGITNPATSLMVDPGPRGGRGVLFGVKQAGVTLGGVLAGVLLPFVSARLDWRIALTAVAILQLATALGLLGLPRSPLRKGSRVETLNRTGYVLRAFPGSLYGAGMAAAQITVMGFMVIYLTQLGHSPIEGGLIYGGALAIAIFARILWGYVSDRVPQDRSLPLRWCAVLGVLGSISLAVPHTGFSVVAAVLVGVGSAAWNGAYIASVVTTAAESGQGASIGRALLVINVGCVAGPLLAAAVLFVSHSWSVMWLSMAVLQVGALVAVKRATVVGAEG